MSQKTTDASSPAPLLFNLALIIVTVLAAVLAASRKLNSERPAPVGLAQQATIHDQKIEARLWEDPLKALHDHETPQTLGELLEQTARHRRGGQLTILPVMIPGGSYSEDREARIRARFSVISALGQRGFVPENAERIGAVDVLWPSVSELQRWLKEESSNWGDHCHWSMKLPLRYEWYEPQVFFPNAAGEKKTPVLLLWLEDEFFEDEPLIRLPLLLSQFGTNGISIRLIGPRRSSTLRAMMPWETPGGLAVKNESPLSLTNRLFIAAQPFLKRISLYSATVSAMDEAFVEHPSKPRAVLSEKLGKYFSEARFFNATDGEMAEAALAELKLRGVDLANPTNHLVLLSEWDTFYGRMLSLTYGAVLSVKEGVSKNRVSFLQNFEDKKNFTVPGNLHLFSYLRGLDGRTTEQENPEKRAGLDSGRRRPESLEEALKWVPDENKAEGPSQFDYLSRIAASINALGSSLSATNHAARIRAIGIVGSDGYDILLILQALRARFPEVLFFTADLDARYSHPKERDWARNLIVVSSYGLTAHPLFQKDIPPFRESAQTA